MINTTYDKDDKAIAYFTRRTKIVATLGPALDDPAVLKRTIIVGANIFRANFSHGNAEDHCRRIKNVRQISKQLGRQTAVFADLQGPKIRIATFEDNKIQLKPDDIFSLDASLTEPGNQDTVGLTYPQLVNDVKIGDILLLDDGRIVLKVIKIAKPRVTCQVVTGGTLSSNKGINRKGGGLSAESLTEKDKIDLKTAINVGVDYIAISFPRHAEDILYAKKLIKEANGGDTAVIAKIERAEAVPAIEEIIAASDAIMVARGDLGIEIGDTELPAVQKRMIILARKANKPVITATQMMESMIHNTIPTRAEVFDVANAVLDMTDAVMLSAETATGNHPDLVVETMSNICISTEKQPENQISSHRITRQFKRRDESIAMAAVYIANHLEIKAIVSLTESGTTPLWMSRLRSATPIFALTRNLVTARKICLYRGVHAFHFDSTLFSANEIDAEAIKFLKKLGLVSKNDILLITKGDLHGMKGQTNTVKIFQVD